MDSVSGTSGSRGSTSHSAQRGQPGWKGKLNALPVVREFSEEVIRHMPHAAYQAQRGLSRRRHQESESIQSNKPSSAPRFASSSSTQASMALDHVILPIEAWCEIVNSMMPLAILNLSATCTTLQDQACALPVVMRIAYEVLRGQAEAPLMDINRQVYNRVAARTNEDIVQISWQRKLSSSEKTEIIRQLCNERQYIRLHLGKCEDKGAVLAGMAQSTKIKTLSFRAPGLSQEVSMKQIIQGFNHASAFKIWLHLEGNDWDYPDLQTLFDTVKHHPSIVYLDLSANHLGKDSRCEDALMEMLSTSRSIVTLKLAGKFHRRFEGIDLLSLGLILARAYQYDVEDKQLKENCLSEAGLKKLAGILPNLPQLQTLKLKGNASKPGLLVLMKALAVNRTLKSLQLAYCDMGDEVPIALAKALKKNTTLEQLDIKGNRIKEKGLISLGEALKKNISLRNFRLTKNEIIIHTKEWSAFTEALDGNKTLVYIELESCPFDVCFERMLATNNNLIHVRLYDAGITDEWVPNIVGALRSRKSTIRLDISRNLISRGGEAALQAVVSDQIQIKVGRVPFWIWSQAGGPFSNAFEDFRHEPDWLEPAPPENDSSHVVSAASATSSEEDSDWEQQDKRKRLRSCGFELKTAVGKPEHGTILHFAQFHSLREFKDNPKALALVVEAQQALLDDLLLLKPKHIFKEAMSETYGPDLKKCLKSFITMAETLRIIFEGYRAGATLDSFQAEIILNEGAAKVYYLLHADVTLHATTTEAAQKKLNKYIDKNRKEIEKRTVAGQETFSEQDKKIICTEREQMAMGLLRQFLANEPQEVGLIFGAGHDFAQYCDQDEFSPRIYQKDYASKARSLFLQQPLENMGANSSQEGKNGEREKR